MTKEFQYLMHAASSAARGADVEVPCGEILWADLFRLAKEQSVPFLMAYALRRRRDLPCPAELRQEWSSRLFSNVMEANEKRGNVLGLLAELEQKGFRPILLKGYVASDCYVMPDCRISSDVDIVVPKKQEAAVCAFLIRKGFTVSPRWTDGHHSICTHPDYGTLEIHASLFDRLVADIWFRDLKPGFFDLNRCVRVTAQDGAYLTLEYTDNLLFMTLHMVKHFINGGLSLRMMLDLGMFVRKYRERIDFPRYWDGLACLHYEKMTAAVYWALVRFCGFSAEDFSGIPEEDPRQVELLLQDMEHGGWMGVNAPDEAEESRLVYSAYMQRRGVANYRLSMLKQKFSKAFRRVFPARIVLLQYCTDSAEKWWLVPVAWWRHFIHGIRVITGLEKSKVYSRLSPGEDHEMLRVRSDVLKQLDMI